MSRTTLCPVCRRPSLAHSRHCGRHSIHQTRYGSATAVPLRYRQEIRPRFHAWITEGFAKYAKHKATAAGLELAQMLLDYQPSAHGFSYELAIRNIMSELKANGIGPQEILIRVAE